MQETKERGVGDTDCGPQTMRRAYIAMKHGNRKSFKEEYRKRKKTLWVDL